MLKAAYEMQQWEETYNVDEMNEYIQHHRIV
jgi:hypothetical protein